MKKKNNCKGFFGIIALAAVLIFALSGCGDTDGGGGNDPVKYTVTFNANGGTVSPSSVQVESGKTVASLPTPTKTTGDTYFLGWYTKNGTTSGDWDSSFTTATPVYASITVYARWEELVARVETRQLTEANWRAILTEINTAGKYVNLDLSACTLSDASTGGGLRSDGTFDPIYNLSTGKDRIVSLILPDAATSIANGTSLSNNTYSTFQHFTSLNSANASAVTDIGGNAFSRCTSLTNVSFPTATTIGLAAFFGCTSLTSASFPQATTIVERAFLDCTSLTSVSFSAAATYINADTFRGCTSLVSFTLTGTGSLSTIENGKALVRNNTELLAYPSASGSITLNNITDFGWSAFLDCTSLTSVSFPQATTISPNAFNGCTNLTSVSFPAVTDIDGFAFKNCTSLTSVSFPQATDIGYEAFSGCTSLASASFPQATDIIRAFAETGTTALTIHLGPNAPLSQGGTFSGVYSTKSVTVKVPIGSTGYGTIPATYSGDDKTENWGNGFRYGGWDGSGFVGGGYGGVSYLNSYITLKVEYQ